MALNFGQLFSPRGKIPKVYNYIDTLTGQGYITFYLASVFDDTGTEIKSLTPQIIESFSKSTDYSELNVHWGAEAVRHDVDFDFEVKLSSILQGKAWGSFLLTSVMTDNGNNTNYQFFRVKLRKYDGSTETEIASAKTPNFTQSGDFSKKRYTLELDISSAVHFNPGDVLRLTVQVVGTQANIVPGDDLNSLTYYHDPNSTLIFGVDNTVPDTDSGEKTDAFIKLPFKINI